MQDGWMDRWMDKGMEDGGIEGRQSLGNGLGQSKVDVGASSDGMTVQVKDNSDMAMVE